MFIKPVTSLISFLYRLSRQLGNLKSIGSRQYLQPHHLPYLLSQRFLCLSFLVWRLVHLIVPLIVELPYQHFVHRQYPYHSSLLLK